MADRTVRVRLEAIIGPFQAQMAQASAAVKSVTGDVAALGKTSSAQAEQFQTMGRAGVVAGAAIAAGMGFAIKAAIDYESAFAGVRKTTDATEAQFAQISDGIREMSRRMPASATEIASVAEAAGQLGVQRDAILPFTETMIELGATTNLTAEQAATAMARLANIMQIPQAQVANLGATLVELGNNGASTESEILDMATRIAGAGRQVGLSSADVLAFANALSSVGIESEAGGTAISRVMIEVQNAVMDGSESLGLFADTAGMSAANFAEAFRSDPADALVSFIEGLRRVGDEGGNTNAVLDALGLADIRVATALRSAAGAGDLFRTSLATGEKAFKNNVALALEYGKRLDTTGAQLSIVKNQLVDVAISFGDEMLPAIRAVAEVLSAFVVGVRELSDDLGPLAPVLMGLAGALTLVGGGFLLLLPRIVATQAAMATLAVTSPALASGLRTVMIASGGIGLTLAAAAAAYALFARNQDDAVASTNKMTAAFDAFARGESDVAQRMVLNTLATDGLLTQLESLGITAEAVTDIMTTHRDGAGKNTTAMKAWAASLAEAVSSGKITQTEADALSKAVFKLGNDFSNLAGDAADVGGAQAKLTPITNANADAYSGATSDVDAFSKALKDVATAAFAVDRETETFTSDLANFADKVMAAKEAGDANAASLDAGTTAGMENREMLRGLVEQAFAVADSMKANGASAEDIAAGLGTLRGSLEDTANRLGLNQAEAQKFIDVLLRVDGVSATADVFLNTDQAEAALQKLLADLNGVLALNGDIGGIIADIVGATPAVAPFSPPSSSGAVTGAVSGEGPAAKAARESAARDRQSAVDSYLRSVHDAQEETKRLQDAVESFLKSLHDHDMELEDNMFRLGDMSKDRYLEILKARLVGLEKYGAEYTRLVEQIHQLEGDALDAELRIIQAVEKQRQFDMAFYGLASQRLLSDSYMTPAMTGGSTTVYNSSQNWSPTFIANGSDATAASATNNQKLRDFAAAMG